MTTGQRIKRIKSVLRLTSNELALKLGIPCRTIGSYERDEATPGEKFLNAMITKLHVNVNWLLCGEGSMFIKYQEEIEINYLSKLQEKFNLTDEEIEGLTDILECSASREMILKFIKIRQGNKEALDNLIYNLQGIKAVYG